MPNNGTIAALIACLAPIVTAVVVLFKLDLTADQQAEIVAGLAGVLTAAATIYASVAHHSATKLAIARTQSSLVAALPDQGDAKSTTATISHQARSRSSSTTK